jgi:outer membrane biosynthesis protein TonB
MNRSGFIALALLFSGPVSDAATFKPGDRVLASPLMMDSRWDVCIVMEAPKGPFDGYKLNCATDPSRETSARTVPAKWVKEAPALLTLPTTGTKTAPAPAQAPPRPKPQPQAPAPAQPQPQPKPQPQAPAPARPQPQPPAQPQPQPAAPRPPVATGANAGGVALGSYECWAFNSPRMLLNFTILSASRYKDSEGATGSYTYDPGTKRIAFTSGLLNGAMPDGFYSIYHEPNGHPTVSFRSRRDSEASFCERVSK